MGQIGKIAMVGEPAGCVTSGEPFEEEHAEQTRTARLCPNMCIKALDTGTVRGGITVQDHGWRVLASSHEPSRLITDEISNASLPHAKNPASGESGVSV